MVGPIGATVIACPHQADAWARCTRDDWVLWGANTRAETTLLHERPDCGVSRYCILLYTARPGRTRNRGPFEPERWGAGSA